ncbi:hypothetical protein [Streptomyces cinerochromogenes]|uniref:hypothetical protein n=1 Tax=Streptomyces cinerochromogenes TaxID=66422 RepID=UPI0016706B06|nr:hypothetical protein [Streptomyces cinerochromogenes]
MVCVVRRCRGGRRAEDVWVAVAARTRRLEAEPVETHWFQVEPAEAGWSRSS